MSSYKGQERCVETEAFLTDDQRLASPEPQQCDHDVGTQMQRTLFFLIYGLLLTSSVTLNIVMLLRSPVPWNETDIQDAQKAVAYEKRTFTSALTYNISTKTAVRLHDGQQEYFGEPSREIDEVWEDLLRGEFPQMTDEEAAPFLPELKRLPGTGGYHFEPDMFHSLHCLNAIRKEVSKTLYTEATELDHALPDDEPHHKFLPAGWRQAHLEHCMDRIRQSLQCQGDLTPSPLYFYNGFPIALGRSGEHTCRKWQPIREWMDERGARADMVDPI